jgi:hypothetical protein
MGMILHDWNLDRKRRLIRSAYEALPEGGVFIVIENLIDDAHRENLFGLMMSLNMLMSSAMRSTSPAVISQNGVGRKVSEESTSYHWPGRRVPGSRTNSVKAPISFRPAL